MYIFALQKVSQTEKVVFFVTETLLQKQNSKKIV
jgi:hypothetical protein